MSEKEVIKHDVLDLKTDLDGLSAKLRGTILSVLSQ